MPPAGSIWTALIAAAAAVAGVLIAQAWTSRREKRQWENQTQMYAKQWEDQRQRDAEQREDQRERDREMWKREDRHRFIEFRREKYADLLSTIENTQRSLLMALADVETGITYGHDAERQVTVQETVQRLNQATEGFSAAVSPVELVAPHSILSMVKEYADFVQSGRWNVVLRRSSQLLESQRLHDLPEEIRVAMRADITGEEKHPRL